MPYPIYDNPISNELIGFIVLVPNTEWMITIVQGAIAELIKPDMFQKMGTADPEEVANLYEDITLRLFMPTVDEIGVIKMSAAENPPFGTLPCDGSSHLRVDYPRLYENIDPIYKTDADNFVTPNIPGRTIVASGSGSGLTARSIGESFGEENHVLSTGEMPAHSHGYSQPVATVQLEGAGVPLPTGLTVIPGLTDSVGLGSGHNNIQPSYVLNFYIVAV